MKLLYITNGITGVGGLERVLSVRASYLADEYEYDITILTLNEIDKEPYYDFSDKIKFESIQVSGNPISYVYKYLSGIRSVIRRVLPDKVVVCDDGLKAFFLPSLFRKITFIYERHVSNRVMFKDSDSFIKKMSSKTQFFLMNRLSVTFQHFVVLNEGNKKEWKNQDNIKVIGNPLSFYPELPATLDNNKAIAVGKQSYQKNYDRMIRIWKEVTSKHSNWELHIYGKEDEKDKLYSLIEELELRSNVFLHAPTPDILEKYLDSSLYLMTSRYEGMPMVLLEAMSVGLPLISVDCPHGPKELIKDGYNGFLVDYEDDNSFFNRVVLLIENEELRKQIGENSRIMSNNYKIDNVASQWVKLFNK